MTTNIKVGLSSYAFTWALGVPGYPPPNKKVTPFDLLQVAHELRASVLQLADNVPLAAWAEKELRSLRDVAKKRGIELQLGTRGVETDVLVTYAELACILEAPVVRTLLDSERGSPNVDGAISMIRQALPHFERRGAVLAIENHDKRSSKELRCLVEQIGQPSVGICFDTANSIGALEDPYEVALVLAPFVVCIHVKDVTIYRPPHQQGFVIEGRPVGKGVLDLKKMLRRILREAKIHPAVLVELWVPYQGTTEQTVLLEDQWRSLSIQEAYNIVQELSKN